MEVGSGDRPAILAQNAGRYRLPDTLPRPLAAPIRFSRDNNATVDDIDVRVADAEADPAERLLGAIEEVAVELVEGK
jgi:hypothetical protein